MSVLLQFCNVYAMGSVGNAISVEALSSLENERPVRCLFVCLLYKMQWQTRQANPKKLPDDVDHPALYFLFQN
ncbi:hypothetical protein FAM09_07520 [Niastella caeni]|uniref:Uncharacterized protein n=1 Tax=Niastella caeni TaxID=2569763 RepID=A0A4S8I4Z1_9BACT|nr:hypothetical protein [Niastella caeni]THU41942.1 hypothetical protein FAM09_07520 [Niastella caeni]